MQQRYIYIHGFASSPASSKAQFFKNKMATIGADLLIPDLNQNNFSTLTLSRQVNQINMLLNTSNAPVTLIGSSLGGLTSAIIAEKNIKINRLVLLAPAFKIKSIGTGMLGKENLDKWKKDGALEMFHYGEGKTLSLNYDFVADLETQNDNLFYQQIPTLLFHGVNDDVVPLEVSREYASTRKWVKYHELDSNHSLDDKLDFIWGKTELFLK